MLSLKFNAVIVTCFLFVNLVLGNLAELNSIFSSLKNDKVCDKTSEPFERHTVIKNLEKALEINLTKSFHNKYECLQKQFDEKLVEMQQYYKLKLNEKHENLTRSHEDKKQKNKKNHYDLLVGQTGFIFYSINENMNVTDFKHESFKFIQPIANETDASLLESEIAAFNSDMVALKAIMANVKKSIKSRVNLLKTIKLNEKEANGGIKEKKEKKKRNKAKHDKEHEKQEE